MVEWVYSGLSFLKAVDTAYMYMCIQNLINKIRRRQLRAFYVNLCSLAVAELA